MKIEKIRKVKIEKIRKVKIEKIRKVKIEKIRKVKINMLTRKQLDEFFFRLEGEEGCDFKKDENGKVIWRCKGGKDKSKAFEILRKMEISEKEIAGFISLCEQYGGYCDCEILFNAEEHLRACTWI